MELGRKFEVVSGSRPGFFKTGVTEDIFSDGGIEPAERKELTMLLMS